MKKKYLIFFLFISINCIGQTWAWAKKAIGTPSTTNLGWAVCNDKNNNVIVTGFFNSSTLVFGNYTLTNTGSFSGTYNTFLAKYDSQGNVLWARKFLSIDNEGGYSVTTDNSGNIFLSGQFLSSNFVIDSYTLTNTGSCALFIIKLDSEGNVLWARTSVGAGFQTAYSISTDAIGNSYITGLFTSTTAVFGSYTLTNTSSTSDIFIVKYDPNGNVLWAKGVVGISHDTGNSVCSDVLGNCYIAGYSSSPTLTFGALTITNTISFGVSKNIFVAKFDSNGNAVWAKNALGGSPSHEDVANSVCTDLNLNVYVTGYFQSPSLSFGTFTINNTGNSNIFLTKYDSNGNEIWVKNSTSIGNSSGRGWSLSSKYNEIFLSGFFTNTLALGSTTLNSLPSDSDPMFIAKFNSNGISLFSQSFSSGGGNHNGISVDDSCGVSFIGSFDDSHWPFIVGAFTLPPTVGSKSIFIGKLSFNCLSAGIHDIHDNSTLINVFPNPSKGKFQINSNQEPSDLLVCLFDSQGLKVFELKIYKQVNEIVTSGLPSGLYVYSLLKNKQVIKRGKLIIE